MTVAADPIPSGPLPSGVGFCIDCRADVQIDERGRCVACGCLGIAPSYGRRITFLTPGLWNVDRASALANEAPVAFVNEPRFNAVRLRPRTESGDLQWAVDYDCCVICGRTDSPPRSKGRCSRCYMKVKNAARKAARTGVPS